MTLEELQLQADNGKITNGEKEFDLNGNVAKKGNALKLTRTINTFLKKDYFNKDMMIGLAILNPVYFLCMMVGAMKTIQVGASVVLGLLLGPIFYLLSPEWSILLGGLIGGTIAYVIGEINVN